VVNTIGMQRGFTYLALLFVLALMGAGLALAGVVWHTAQTREKERELLYVGNQYKKAIERYFQQGKTYPRELAQLLRDQRTPDVRRYLRKLYRDPITNTNEWGLVKTPDGAIAGIFSVSEQKPMKTGNFPLAYAEFEGKAKYSDWKFVYSPQTTPGAGAAGAAQQRAPGAGAATQGTGAPATGGAGSQQPAAPAGTPAATTGSQAVSGSAPSGFQQSAPPAGGAEAAQTGRAGGAQSTARGFSIFQQNPPSEDGGSSQSGAAGGAQTTSPGGGFGLLQQSAPGSGGAGSQPTTPATESGSGLAEPATRPAP